LYDWEQNSKVQLGGNVCSYSLQNNNQSPLDLGESKWWQCNDRHSVRDWGGVGCAYNFTTTPYGLRADISSCAKFPTEDLSRTTTPWELVSIQIKTPSEHRVDGKQFDGEFIMQHRGTGIHYDRLTFVSVFMDASGDTKNWELEKFLRMWGGSQAKQYKECGKYYDIDTCSVKKMRRNLRKHNNITLYGNYESYGTMYGNYPNKTATDRKLFREKFRPYNLIKGRTSEYYYGYEGSLLEPPCSEKVNWRILKTPMKISKYHLEAINYMIAAHIDESTCKLGTAGKRRNKSSCFVDVTRPVQKETQIHHMIDCTHWTD